MSGLKNVLSLFDGISCGQLALQRAGINYDNYFASEIKKNAIIVTNLHFSKTIQIGDVTKIDTSKLPKIDLLIGGSPCQNFSVACINGNDKYGLEGKKSSLFFEYLRILNEVKPKYFLLENVKMKNESKKELDNYIGQTGITINSSLVSYQNRSRVYWTNIPFEIPNDLEINFQDHKETCPEICEVYKVNKTASRIRMWSDGKGDNSNIGGCKNITFSKKIKCITTKQDRSPNSGLIRHKDFCRYLTRRELEQGQTLPIGYTNCISYNQAQEVIGDSWTVDIISHIFRGIK